MLESLVEVLVFGHISSFPLMLRSLGALRRYSCCSFLLLLISKIEGYLLG